MAYDEGLAQRLRERLDPAGPVFTGRSMAGWVTVASSGVEDDAVLAGWVDEALAVVRTLPPK